MYSHYVVAARADLVGLADTLSNASVLEGACKVEGIPSEAILFYEDLRTAHVTMAQSALEISWQRGAPTMQQLRVVEDAFVEVLLSKDDNALLWDAHHMVLHDAEHPRCATFEPARVDVGDQTTLQIELLMAPAVGRPSAATVLRSLVGALEELVPHRLGFDETASKRSTSALRSRFTDLWDGGEDVVWTSLGGWTVTASESVATPWSGPLSTLVASRPSNLSDAMRDVQSVREQLVALGRALRSPVGRVRWLPSFPGPTPWPWCPLAPDGWWLGFDNSPHAALYFDDDRLSQVLRSDSLEHSWRIESFEKGGSALWLPKGAVAQSPPSPLLARLECHTVVAPLAPLFAGL